MIQASFWIAQIKSGNDGGKAWFGGKTSRRSNDMKHVIIRLDRMI